MVPAVHLVAMAKVDHPPFQFKHRGPFEYARLQGLFKERAHVKVVVPLEIDDFSAVHSKVLQRVQHRQIMTVRNGAVADPEFEQIAENEECVGGATQGGQELEQHSIVMVVGAAEMGIGDKYVTHGGNYIGKAGKGKERASRGHRDRYDSHAGYGNSVGRPPGGIRQFG